MIELDHFHPSGIAEGTMPCHQATLDAVMKGLKKTSLFGGQESLDKFPHTPSMAEHDDGTRRAQSVQ